MSGVCYDYYYYTVCVHLAKLWPLAFRASQPTGIPCLQRRSNMKRCTWCLHFLPFYNNIFWLKMSCWCGFNPHYYYLNDRLDHVKMFALLFVCMCVYEHACVCVLYVWTLVEVDRRRSSHMCHTTYLFKGDIDHADCYLKYALPDNDSPSHIMIIFLRLSKHGRWGHRSLFASRKTDTAFLSLFIVQEQVFSALQTYIYSGEHI